MRLTNNPTELDGTRPTRSRNLRADTHKQLLPASEPPTLHVHNEREPRDLQVPTRTVWLSVTKYTALLVAAMLTLALVVQAPIIQVLNPQSVQTPATSTVSQVDSRTCHNDGHLSASVAALLAERNVCTVFVEQISEDEPYAAGKANLRSNTIYLRSTLTRDLNITAIHEVAHLEVNHAEHSADWCQTYYNHLLELVPERAEGQAKQLKLRYGCEVS